MAEMASCSSLGHGRWRRVPQVPHNSLYICINKWDFNGAPSPPPRRYHCVIVCLLSWPSTLFLYLFHSFLGSIMSPQAPSRFLFISPTPLSWSCT